MNNIDNNTMQNRLYDILKMNIKLAKDRNNLSSVPTETFESFEQVCRKIDNINHEKYESELASLYTVTTTLEEEKERLEKLIRLISDRIDERNRLIMEYQELTFKVLDGLENITDMNNLNMYKDRLVNIREYLDNNKNIVDIENELVELNKDLEASMSQQISDEEKNFDLEDSILAAFRNVLKTNEEYVNINGVVDIEFELEKLEPKVKENKKTLDTFEKAFKNLKNAGISTETEIEYSTYVTDAKKTYYQSKEEEFLLKIYKLLLDSKNQYSELFDKRERLDKVLKERTDLRKKLEISKEDILHEVYNIIEEQKIQIKAEKSNIDKINRLRDKIVFKEKKLEGYKEANQKVEILTILQEYGIIETYISDMPDPVELEMPISDIELGSTEDVKLSFGDLDSSILEEEVEEANPYAIRQVMEVPEGINVSFVKNKANTVMRRVGKALGFEPPKVESSVIKEEPFVSVEVPIVEEIKVEPEIKENLNKEVKVEDIPMFTVEPVVEILPDKKEEVKVEEVKNDLFFESSMPFAFEQPEIKLPVMEEIIPKEVEKVKPQVEPVNEVEIKKEEPINSFWPESKPVFPSDIKLDSSLDDSFVSMAHPFPEVKEEDNFNPQALNAGNDFIMPDIPMGNVTLSSESGVLSSPMRIRRM